MSERSAGAQKRLPVPFSASIRLALAVVRGYQLIVRPFLTGSCRYLPTCSEYAAEAILTYGALKGGWIGLKRVSRCHPFGGFGLDPVPIDSRRVADVADLKVGTTAEMADLKVGTTSVGVSLGSNTPVVPTFRSATEV